MNNPECEFSDAIIRATKSNQWPDALRNHAATCSRCKETIEVTTMMNELATQDLPHPLSHYRTIWLKARYARKQERLTKFDILALAGISVSGFAGFAALLIWLFPQLSGRILDIRALTAPHLPHGISVGAPMFILGGVLVTVWLLTRDSIFAER